MPKLKAKPRKHARPSLPREIKPVQPAIALMVIDPSDPTQWGLDASLGSLQVHSNVIVETDAAKRPTRARRDDIFRLLRNTRTQVGTVLNQDHILAIDRLETDIALRTRTMGSSGVATPIDAAMSPNAIEDIQIMAAERIERVLLLTGSASAKLLLALLKPTDIVMLFEGRRSETDQWRDTVSKITGVTNAAAQPGQIRMACENLVGAYTAYDQEPRVVSQFEI